MYLDAIKEFEELKNQPQVELNHVRKLLTGVQASIKALTDKLLKLDPSHGEYKTMLQTRHELRQEEEIFKLKVSLAEKKVNDQETLPTVKAAKAEAVRQVEDRLRQLEQEKEAIEQSIKAVLDKAYSLTAQYYSLQLDQKRIVMDTGERLELSNIGRTVNMNSLPPRRLITLNDMQADGIIKDYLKRN
jgi:chromosome segregation ATPase